MYRSKKRLLAMILVMAMLITVVLFQSGCGTKSTEDTSSTVAAATTATTTTPATPEPPVELTIMGPAVFGAQAGVQDDPVAKEIEKLTGVRMSLTAANAISDMNAKIAAQIASNDLADITYFQSNDLMQNAVTANILLPMDDLIKQYGQDLQKNVPLMLNYSKTNQSVGKSGIPDGKTYVLGGLPVGPYGVAGGDSYAIPWVRWDLYKKLGYPSVDSVDDYIPLMKKLVALEPKTPDGKKTYAAGAFLGDTLWNADAILWATIPFEYGITCNTFANNVDMLSNDFLDFLGDPNSKYMVAAKFWNQIYREGMLDPESFTMKKDNYIEKVTQGRYPFTFMGQYAIDYNAKAAARGEKEKYFVMLPPPKDTKAVWVVLNQPVGTPTNGVAISKNCKYPEKAMKLLNFFGSKEGMMLVTNGIKGQTWDIVDGKPATLPGEFDKHAKDPNYQVTTGAGRYSGLMFITEGTKNPDYDMIYNIFTQESLNVIPNPAYADFCQHYGVSKPMDLITKQAQIVASAPENALIPAMPQDIMDLSNNVDKFEFDNFVKMIIAKNENDFVTEQTKFMEGANKAGNQKVIDWLKAERVKALEKFNAVKQGN